MKLKVFSYDALNSPKKRMVNVSVRLKGSGFDQKHNLTGDSLTDGFRGLNKGTYKLEFKKSGYEKRAKNVDLDCDLVDENNGVWNYTYLWREKNSTSNQTDLISDDVENALRNSASDPPATSTGDSTFGDVTLKVLIDVDGNVVAASRVDGERKLAARAITLAKRAKFSPTLVKGEPYQVTGTITYKFVP